MHKILIVDDDIDILMLVKMSLTMNNFQVDAVSKWEDIDTRIIAFAPELILLDISLEGADGRVICKNLKAAPQTSHLPVILFSANTELGKTFRNYDAQDFVEKPYQLAHLLQTIRQHLPAGNTGAQLPPG